MEYLFIAAAERQVRHPCPASEALGARPTHLRVALAALLLLAPILAPGGEAGNVQARSETTIPMPADTKDKPLKGLMLGDRQQESVAEITAIRLKSLPAGDVEPLKVIWVVTMSNTRPITQVAHLKLSLRDAEGERLSTARGRLSIATGTSKKEYEVKMKAKAADWEASHKLQLEVAWSG